ncbi:hypothetical protein DXG01_015494 [Tephrocybe rancida]|nr:hypothetical protein DXG01_015494 [Tephrocybe rancida]
MLQSDSEDFERDSQTQFVAQDGDEDILWEVVEITAEKTKSYKVRWAGVDPRTCKPWPQSWVAKADCTDDLVHEWKRKKLKKKGAKGSHLSGASRASGVEAVSVASSSTAMKRSTRGAKSTAAQSSRAQNTGKRTRSVTSVDDGQEEESTALRLGRPKKKQKINVEQQKVGTDQTRSRPAGRRNKHAASDDEQYQPPMQESGDEVPHLPILGSDDQVFDLSGAEESRRPNKNKATVLEKIEEDSGSDDDTVRLQPGGSPAGSPTSITNSVRQPLPQTPPPESTPEPDTMYVKFKSGKLSTPQKKRRRSSESAADPSSPSDEVDLVVPTRPRTPPVSTPPHPSPSISPPNAQHPQEVAHEEEEHIVQEMYKEFVDFDAQPPPINGRLSTNWDGANGDSYRQGVVPETETESSNNTQSQSQPQHKPPLQQRQPSPPPPQQLSSQEDEPNEPPPKAPQRTCTPPPKPSRVPTEIIQPQPTPARSSLISKMRPRTPGSSSRISLFDDNAEYVYHQPELEVHPELDEDSEETEAADELERNGTSGANSRAGRISGFLLGPMPRLSPSQFVQHLPSAASTSTVRNCDSTGTTAAEESDEDEVAELVSSIEQFSSPEKGRRKHRSTLDKLRWKGKERARESDRGGSATEGEQSDDEGLEEAVLVRGQQLAAQAREQQKKRQREYDGEHADGKRRTLTELLSNNTGRKGKEKRQRDLGAKKTKLSKTNHTSKPWWEQEKKSRRMARSREQSEPLETVEDDGLASDAMALREEEEESTQDLMMEAEASRPVEDVEMGQTWDVEPIAEILEAAELQEEAEPQASSPPNEVEQGTRARSKSSASSGRSAQRKPSKDNLVLPPTAPLLSSQAIESQEQDNQPDFVATLALLNEKSQENAQLTKEISALREALVAAQAPRPREMDLELELQQVRESLQTAQSSFAESERRVAELTQGKGSAEKEREFFREHYAKASGFVTTVREENSELEEQAKIARDQATAGVETVKATYVARIKALEDDVRTYKRLAMFIMEKDMRTNDDVRQRAAEAPELRARCEELAKDNRGLHTDLTELQDIFDRKRARAKQLKQQLKIWKKQATALNADLSKVKSAQEGEDTVYQCSWRIDDDANEPCGQEFTTYEEFEAHMFSNQHLDFKHAFIH